MPLADLLRAVETFADTTAFDPDDLGNRDPRLVEQSFEWLAAIADRWFRLEVQGEENLPATGQVIAIGNHNGAPIAVDTLGWLVVFTRKRGFQDPWYGLVHDVLFRSPLTPVGRWAAKLGGIRAGAESARRVVRAGATLWCNPGGGNEASRSFWRRGEIDFCGRTGWAKIALESKVPILPVVTSGAHETAFILHEGRGIARALGLKDRLRLEYVPIYLGLPWGLWVTPFVPYLPLPTKVRMSLLPLIHPEGEASDEACVRALADRVEGAMQTELTRLERERRRVILG